MEYTTFLDLRTWDHNISVIRKATKELICVPGVSYFQNWFISANIPCLYSPK